jgi:hypothetical protein
MPPYGLVGIYLNRSGGQPNQRPTSRGEKRYSLQKGGAMRMRGRTAIGVLLGLSMLFGASGEANAHNKPIHHRNQRVSVYLFGDSLAFTLGFGLNQPALVKKYDYHFDFLGILGCGIVDGPAVTDLTHTYPTPAPCNGKPPLPGEPLSEEPWPVQWQAALSHSRANVAVLLAGRWEVDDRVYMGQWTNILNPTFAAYVKQQLELASNLVTATGANMVFMTAPCVKQTLQPDGAPWPQDSPDRLSVYNQLVEQVAAEYPATDSVLNLNSIVCPGGQFTSELKGVTIRTNDGVHFTNAAGPVLTPLIMPKILASGRAEMARAAELKAEKTPS